MSKIARPLPDLKSTGWTQVRKPPDGDRISALHVPSHTAYGEVVAAMVGLLGGELGCTCEATRRTLELCAGELFANAAQGRDPIAVFCLNNGSANAVTVLVRDTGGLVPKLRHVDPDEMVDGKAGRLVVDGLTLEYGCRALAGGKDVWVTARLGVGHECDDDR